MSSVAFHEAVFSFALALVWLISTFRHKIESYIVYLIAIIWFIIAKFSTFIKKFSTATTGYLRD